MAAPCHADASSLSNIAMIGFAPPSTSSTVKRIPIECLAIGMYVDGFDCSWFKTPFLRHKFSVRTSGQIERLRRFGITEVRIDLSRGCDVPLPAQESVRRSVPDPAMPVSAAATLTPVIQDLVAAREAQQQLARSVQSVFRNIAPSGALRHHEIDQMAREIVIVTRTLNNPAAFLAVSQARDTAPELSDHALSVCAFSMILGEALGYNPARLQMLATGALLHDIGLLQLPHELSRPRTALSKQARILYESHPRLGAVRLEQQQEFPQDVRRIVAEHHATPDGLGYPKETLGYTTSEYSRIVMVADRYDELLTGHAGRRPLPIHQALQQLYQDGQEDRLDDRLISWFVKLVGVYPVGSLVELNTGEYGMVTALTPDKLHQPVVTLFKGPEGRLYNPPLTVDLSKDSQKRTIKEVLDPAKVGAKIEDLLAAQSSAVGTAV